MCARTLKSLLYKLESGWLLNPAK